MRIYMAGKISRNDWRGEFLGTHRPASLDQDAPLQWEVLTGAVFGVHDYVGPFFVGDDHGCYHGNSSHGMGVSRHASPCVEGVVEQVRREQVVHTCMAAIDASDLVFAWIGTDLTCYGTLVELGIAAARGRSIIIGTTDLDTANESWFACHLPTARLIVAPEASLALKLGLENHARNDRVRIRAEVGGIEE